MPFHQAAVDSRRKGLRAVGYEGPSPKRPDICFARFDKGSPFILKHPRNGRVCKSRLRCLLVTASGFRKR